MSTLLFVYNADSGLFNFLADVGHKVFAPATYACNLCALTHGPLSMRREWKTFLAGLGRPLEFLHRDELRKQYPHLQAPLPAIFVKDDRGGLSPLLDAAALNAISSLADLEHQITTKLKTP
jgi:hypothetical protein